MAWRELQHIGQSMGVRKTADFLEKSTWVLAASILFLCIIVTTAIPRQCGTAVENQTQIDNAVDPNAVPVLPSIPVTTDEE